MPFSWNALWKDDNSFCRRLLKNEFDLESASQTLSELRSLEISDTLDAELVSNLWLVPLLLTTRGLFRRDFQFRDTALGMLSEIRRLFGLPGNEASPKENQVHDPAQFADWIEKIEMWRNFDQNGFLAVLRRGLYSEKAFLRFIQDLEKLPRMERIARSLLTYLWMIPTFIWYQRPLTNQAPRDLTLRVSLLNETLPKLGQILGLPFKGVLEEMLTPEFLQNPDH